jgi:hypothetical protein
MFNYLQLGIRDARCAVFTVPPGCIIIAKMGSFGKNARLPISFPALGDHFPRVFPA